MMLKTGQALASGQAKAISGGTPARLRPCANRKHAAFKGGRADVRAAAAQPEASEPAPTAAPKARRAKREVTVDLTTVSPGDEFDGTVTAVEGYGAFVDFGAEKDGLVHISQLSNKFLKNAGDAVASGDAVKVRVLSVDAASGKIALTMKAESAADDGELERDDAAEGGELLPAEGHEFVYADAVADFEFPFQMREDAAMTIADVNEFEDAELDAEPTFDLPLPLNELVKGTVTRVEDFGAFMTVSVGGRELKAFLERDEAKVPSAGLSAEQLAAYGVQAGDVVPEYIDAEMDSMKEAYKVGDVVTAFVLDFTDRGELNVTQYTDAEVEADGFDIEDDDNEEVDEEPLSVMGTEGYDVLAVEPEDLLDEEEDKSRGPVSDDGGELSAAAQDYKVFGRGTPLSGSLYSKSGMTMPAVSFPDRPLDKLDANAINNLSNVDTDFDGDEIYLDELWQESIPVPKSALKKLGLKAEISEDGQVEIVEREGAEVVDEDVLVALQGDIDARTAAFVEDLMEDNEDEAEIPAYAMRRPLVLAAAVGEISAKMVKALRQKTGAGMMDCKKALGECAGDETAAIDWLRKKGLSGADKKAGRVAAEGAIVQYIHPGARLGVLLEVNCETDFVAASEKFQSLVNELGMIIAASPDVQVVSEDDVSADMLAKEREVQMGLEELKSKPEAIRAKIVEGRLDKIKKAMALMNQDSLRDTTKTVGEIVKETIAATGENVQIRRFVKYQLGEGIEKKSTDFAAEVAEQTQAKAKASEPKPEDPKKKEEAKKEEEAVATVAVSAKTVKELRGATGAGMMDCKKALACNNNDLTAATEWLRKKGLSGADKKAGRIAAEGAIISYIHPGSRLGVMMEINCETDFVAAGDQFNQLANGIAMQIAASPDVQYVSAEDIPAEVFEREKEIEMQREDLKAKPEAIRAKIAEGRVAKLAQTMALLPQPFLMDDSKTIEQAVKEAIASIGEKISIRRFITYRLGEGIEKKQMDLAADVAAMTGGKL